MDGVATEWVGLLLRWLHIVTAMAWIGSSFYFMHVDAALKPAPDMPAGKGGEAECGAPVAVAGVNASP